ncbi:MAG: signal peptidase I [Candidatus Sungbacteria bacterium RIFCSPHIGHO2_01_FULL_50_25]|uniref:Signal peptidase I n=1 Tax=Candidatus Sungbacteria bacterium RIFCSPHIGHO2_01_FULL_50_25 TaxID=1802265 RepID=A0A1G2KA58_9BACT|nr:MAG: signal peptidase I [Candidatus Sungbacteria bacterium RIFCSPHIGHO2_01_FULL_50_25]
MFRILIISFVIVVPIRYFVVQPFIVRGSSMEPNFYDREYLIIDEISYYFREPARGETIVFRYPRDPRQYFIKRIIGLPGERVEIVGGRVKVYSVEKKDGFILEESYLPLEDRATQPAIEAQLGKDEYFVLGDNRDASSDSRVWGPLEQDFITGRAILRAWPISRFGVLSGFSLQPE